MERTQAFATLRLDATADGREVKDAYWKLVRQAQTEAAVTPERAEDIERLNDAYTTLTHVNPQSAPAAPLPAQERVMPEGTGVAVIDAFVDWVAAEALRTRQRWPGRNPELALIGGGALVLMFAAIGAGASLIAVFLAMAVVLVAIWAPWRRVS